MGVYREDMKHFWVLVVMLAIGVGLAQTTTTKQLANKLIGYSQGVQTPCPKGTPPKSICGYTLMGAEYARGMVNYHHGEQSNFSTVLRWKQNPTGWIQTRLKHSGKTMLVSIKDAVFSPDKAAIIITEQ